LNNNQVSHDEPFFGSLKHTTLNMSEEELALIKRQLKISSDFMVSVILSLILFTFFLKKIANLTAVLGSAALITSVAMLFLLFALLFFIKKTGYSINLFGFTLQNWKKSILDAAIYTVPILLLITIIKGLLIYYIPVFSNLELFSLGNNIISKGSVTQTTFWGMFFLYVFISSPIQEIIFRGGLQSFLQLFLLNKHRKLLANITANFVFAVMHLVFSDILALLAFIVGMFWGWLYQRNKTLVGVIFSHVLLGTWAFFILGIQSLVFI
jgi:membrane protease YdiL (CAAX protease family)